MIRNMNLVDNDCQLDRARTGNFEALEELAAIKTKTKVLRNINTNWILSDG